MKKVIETTSFETKQGGFDPYIFFLLKCYLKLEGQERLQKYSFHSALVRLSAPFFKEDFLQSVQSNFAELVLPEIDPNEFLKKEEITSEQIKHEMESFKKLRFRPTVLGTIDRELKTKVYDSMKGCV